MMPRKKVTIQERPHHADGTSQCGRDRCRSHLLMAAVSPDRTSEPVRSFGTFTTDLHRLADWFAECGVETVAMESTSVYGFRSSSFSTPAASLCSLSMHAMPSTCPGARPTSAMHSGCSGFILRSAARQLSAQRSFHRVARLPRQRERLLEYAASHIQHMQKALTRDEPPTPPCRRRYHRRNWIADHPSDPLRRA